PYVVQQEIVHPRPTMLRKNLEPDWRNRSSERTSSTKNFIVHIKLHCRRYRHLSASSPKKKSANRGKTASKTARKSEEQKINKTN
ncbi:hypothetical protein, partial [Shewanella algae]|uniref:hypothetical protein n=1 Tax=Shewanella algae TaxID=38313 RepID=UPI0031F59960